MPFTSPWKENFGKINENAESFHLPPLVEIRKDGKHFRKIISGIKIDPSNIILSTIKESIEGQGYIIRLYNPSDRTQMVSVELPNSNSEVNKVRLDESFESKIDLINNSFTYETKGFSIDTFLIKK
jgi:alpha-mannosidase